MATCPPSKRLGLAQIAAVPLLMAAAFLVTALLLASELESNVLGLIGACMVALVATALRGAVGGARRR